MSFLEPTLVAELLLLGLAVTFILVLVLGRERVRLGVVLTLFAIMPRTQAREQRANLSGVMCVVLDHHDAVGVVQHRLSPPDAGILR